MPMLFCKTKSFNHCWWNTPVLCLFCSWVNCLNPEINKSAWTGDENVLLLQLHEKLGNHWAEIAKYLPGRYGRRIFSLCMFELNSDCEIKLMLLTYIGTAYN